MRLDRKSCCPSNHTHYPETYLDDANPPRNCEEGRKIKLTRLLLNSSGYHVPAVRRRDMFYAKLEDQRAEALGQI